MRADKVGKERIASYRPCEEELSQSGLADPRRLRDSKQFYFAVLKVLQSLCAWKQLLSPRQIKLLLRRSVLLYINTETVKEVRSVKQMALVVQVEHPVGIHAVPDHLVRGYPQLLVKGVCVCEVIVIVDGRSIVALAVAFDLHRAVHLQFPAEVERIPQRIRIIPRYQLRYQINIVHAIVTVPNSTLKVSSQFGQT